MISELNAVQQIARLGSLTRKNAISKTEAAEYLRVVRSTAKTDHQIRAAIDTWIDSQTFPPSPAELRNVIESTPLHESGDELNCPECHGSGRRSFWALITVERWPDSGRIKRRALEEIPVEGDPNLWLLQWPRLASQVDGKTQTVEIVSGFCRCRIGQQRKSVAVAAA